MTGRGVVDEVLRVDQHQVAALVGAGERFTSASVRPSCIGARLVNWMVLGWLVVGSNRAGLRGCGRRRAAAGRSRPG
jgi:hypothetical protein